MNIIQRYEMIRSILKREKSPDQVSKETKTPLKGEGKDRAKFQTWGYRLI